MPSNCRRSPATASKEPTSSCSTLDARRNSVYRATHSRASSSAGDFLDMASGAKAVLAFASESAPGRGRNIRGAQTIFVEQLIGRSRFRVGVVDAHEFHHRRM